MRLLGFIGLTLLSVILFYLGTGKDKRVLLISIPWILIIGALAYSGYFMDTWTKPPRFGLVFAGAIGMSLFLYKIVDGNQLHADFLLAVHALRLPVELGLYQLYLDGEVPVLMTFKGWNWDIVMGISAILLLFYRLFTGNRLPALFVLVWNAAGVIFLTIIVTIAVLSSPLPFQQLAFEQPNKAVLEFPFVYLPAYIVPVVLLSHVLAIKNRYI